MNEELFKTIVNNLKNENPIKFFEVAPDLIVGLVSDKLKQVPVVKEYADIIDPVASILTKEAKKNIENKISKSYNFGNVVIGATIFLVGRHILTNHWDLFFSKQK